MILPRRKFLTLMAAPIVVSACNIMPVKTLPIQVDAVPAIKLYAGDIVGDGKRMGYYDGRYVAIPTFDREAWAGIASIERVPLTSDWCRLAHWPI
jgi:hypothetical protein